MNSGLIILLLVIGALTGLSFLGGFTLNGHSFRPVRLYSDLTRGLTNSTDNFPDDSLLWAQIKSPARPATVPEAVSETEPEIEPASVPVSAEPAEFQPDSTPAPATDSVISTIASPIAPIPQPQPAPATGNIPLPTETPAADSTLRMRRVPIEDFSEDGSGLSHFFAAIRRREELGRPVRIAFLGDSFVEGDILTSDLREYLQTLYGGRGVGFVPLAPVDIWRNTVSIEHEGWQTLSSLYRDQSAPYLFGGQCFTPEAGEARITVRTTDQRQHAETFNTASLLYTTAQPASLVYDLGGSGEKEAALEPGEGLKLFTATRPGMRRVDFRLLASEEFTGYGLFLNDETGVCVDNYALRSASGIQLLRIGANRLAQMNRLVPYDLVILQYGLNVMTPERQEYQTYTEQMIRVVERIRQAMPEADILIFGIGDRNFKDEAGEMVTGAGLIAFIEAQRRIAQETGVTFWNTYLAMGGRNSMRAFVDHAPALANKDYTHINYLGGRRIGLSFARSLAEMGEQY
ncbi:MAG: GDSL-type esterase/lipase family protein [Rikenellaceae bacterium]|nr:GDSL-type esterase/lipase family protein [Rikenellaceae bacterium]